MTDDLVSVVIPCRNEVRAIAGTVRAILAGDHKNLEVLVVDGMSDDGTRQVLEKLTREDARVRVIDNPKRLTPFAFNLGCKNARGSYVQIVGSRNVMAPNYISTLMSVLKQRPDIDCVGGDYQHVCDSSAGRMISLAMESKFGVGGGNYRTMNSDTLVDTVGVPMYRASIFHEVGYFDENLTRNQDDEFNFRLRQAGRKILYVHDAKVTYLVRPQLGKAFQQFRQYGYFKVFVNKKHKALTTFRQVVPAAFFALFALGIPMALVVPQVSMLLGVVALAYILGGLVLAGPGLSLVERFLVLRACFVLHAGYAWGYWQGIYDFVLVGRAPRTDLQRQTT